MTNQIDTDVEHARSAHEVAPPSASTTLVAIFATHAAAETAITELGTAGIPLWQLSIIGKDYRTEEHPVGFYNVGDRVRVWGARGAFWGALIGLLVSPAFFILPLIGHIVVFGPLTSALVGTLEGATVGGGVSALAGALASVGVPRDSIVRYEAAIKADQFVVIVHRADELEAEIAERVLRASAQSVDRT